MPRSPGVRARQALDGRVLPGSLEGESPWRPVAALGHASGVVWSPVGVAGKASARPALTPLPDPLPLMGGGHRRCLTYQKGPQCSTSNQAAARGVGRRETPIMRPCAITTPPIVSVPTPPQPR